MTSPDPSDLDESTASIEVPNSNATVPTTSAKDNQRRAARNSGIVAGLIMVSLCVAINLPMQYSESAILNRAKIFVDFPEKADPLPVMAGWPYRYSIRYDAIDTRPALSVFSASALFRNTALALAIIALVCLFIYRRTLHAPAAKTKKFRVSIGDLLALTLLVAAPIGFWNWLGREQEKTRAISLEVRNSDGSVGLSAWTPSLLTDHLPTPLLERLRKIRTVHLENANESVIEKAAAIPTMTRFAVGGGDYDLSVLNPLARSIHLNDLRISGRAIDATTIKWIAKKHRLRSLNLMRTNVNAQAVTALGELPGLQNLNLMRSDVQLAELGRPGWAETIETLWLPLPETGQSAELEIDGWPHLKELYLAEFDTTTNPVAIKVRLRNLPELNTIYLDQFQKMDLELTELPNLQDIARAASNWGSRLPRGGMVPGSIWLERFAGSGLPELTDLKIFCVDMKSYSLRGPTKIKSLGMGVFYHSQSAAVRDNPYERELLPEHAKAIVEGLGNSIGPAEVDLDAVPLEGVDLSPLANNKQLTRLFLGESNTKLEQWRSLSEMKWLRHLRLSGNPSDLSAVRWALETFPNLEKLEIGEDPFSNRQTFNSGFVSISMEDDLNALELIGHEHLTTYVRKGTEYYSAHAVKIIDMPKLVMEVDVDWPESIEIRNAPMLTGIRVEGLFPAQTLLDPMPNLSYFAGGGPEVTDAIARAVSASNQLKRLTMAYPTISAETLAKLPVASMERLALPGSNVDDAVVQSWPDLPMITHLDLSETQITAESLPKLLASPMIESINLNHCPIQIDEFPDIGGRRYLVDLNLAGIGISANRLNQIFADAALKSLDLSNTTVPNEVIDALIENGSSLHHLSLQDSEFDNSRLLELIKTHRQLKIDVGGASTIDTKLQTALLSAERLKTKREWQEETHIRLMSQQMQSQGGFVSPTAYEYQPDSMIHVADYSKAGEYSQYNINSMQFPATMLPLTSEDDSDAAVNDSESGWFDKVVGALFGNGNGSGNDPVTDISTTLDDEPMEIDNATDPEAESTSNPVPAGDQP